MSSYTNIKKKYHNDNIIEINFGIDYGDAILLLMNSKEFRNICTNILRNIEYDNYYWYFGKMGHKNYDTKPFKFWIRKATDISPVENDTIFKSYIKKSINVISNLDNNCLLMIPKRNKSSPKNTYASMANFMRTGLDKQIDELWISIANLSICLDDIEIASDKGYGAIWISTHGSGVPYLHIRFDTSPKYLDWVPKIDDKGAGQWAPYLNEYTLNDI